MLGEQFESQHMDLPEIREKNPVKIEPFTFHGALDILYTLSYTRREPMFADETACVPTRDLPPLSQGTDSRSKPREKSPCRSQGGLAIHCATNAPQSKRRVPADIRAGLLFTVSPTPRNLREGSLQILKRACYLLCHQRPAL
ncbi:hypothetical protein PoB_000036200 [Plakobranchus ocellatus]|uniref:Uncharacterized protein n=1 Tax=Plakobranchus ocellatus TaxID=259542 RepID=A0AAV3XUP3_9GAST|nr:hypothetical protein PoB_000036200 [Plakobranchus ocellatus]